MVMVLFYINIDGSNISINGVDDIVGCDRFKEF